ncbi:hypothetical protein UL82_03845 [Corynebacterium kutscheri]|uniref:Uncharacterized protein n=1 Tax=Corynebacterium kutscheri TaxID=35755 RepID=A0A0F6QZX9_9CORY|nr:hypothetical protein UL82_03845 [Corynebacterium kutscheri]
MAINYKKRMSRRISRILYAQIMCVAAIHLDQPLLATSSSYPQVWASNPVTPAQTHPKVRPFDLAPSGVYLATYITAHAGALLPHPFTLTCNKTGGLLSVALALGSLRVAVNNHRAHMESGLSSTLCHTHKNAGTHRRDRPAGSFAVFYSTDAKYHSPSARTSDHLYKTQLCLSTPNPNAPGETFLPVHQELSAK